MPAGSSANTAPAWGTRPTRDCSPRRLPGSSLHEAVVGFDGDIEGVVKVESTVTTALVDLAAELAEHLVSVDQLDEHLGRVISASMVSSSRREARDVGFAVKAARTQLAERRSILPLLRDYARQSRATRWTSPTKWPWPLPSPLRFPQVGAEERSRYRVVLLDEFQDTSEAQLHLLRSIFAPLQGQWP